MANRRCINCKEVLSPRFQRMKPASKSLFMVLIAMADDDGVVEADGALSVTGSRKTALQELIDMGYVAMLEQSENIVWIVGWQSFNSIDVRYGTASYYRSTLKEHFPNIKLLDLKVLGGYLPVGNTREREEKRREDKRRERQASDYVEAKDDKPFKDDDHLELPFK